LNGLFALLRSFDENALEIFRKFEMFAYDFIDGTAPQWLPKNAGPARRIHHGRNRFQVKSGPQTPSMRNFGNRRFTMTRVEANLLSARLPNWYPLHSPDLRP
jgi:hypothetical protein